MSDLAWYKAAGVLRLSADERAAGWPAAFTAERLARLQYPSKGSARERAAFMMAIKGAIEAGAVRPEYKDVTITQQKREGVFVSVGASAKWLERDFGGLPRHSLDRVVTKQYDVRLTLISCGEFACWWGKQSEEASEHIAAWLAFGAPGGEEASRNSRIFAAVEAGKSQAKVAEEFGITRGRVGQIVRAIREKSGDGASPPKSNSSTWALFASAKTVAQKLPTSTRKTVKR